VLTAHPGRSGLIRLARAVAAEDPAASRALAYTLLGRAWSVAAGPLSLIFVARFLSREEQGFYFTFWSLAGLWVFFDLGLATIIVQFASHERASLQFADGVMTGDDAAYQRLASLYSVARRWYAGAALLLIAIVLPIGFFFFTHYHAGDSQVHWQGPWSLVVLFTALNVAVGPFTAILEGCGRLSDIALMRLLQAMTANVLLWVALIDGGSLYAAAVLSGTMACFAAMWMLAKYRRFFGDLAAVDARVHRIRWRSDIWPFQWRFAMSWMAGYFTFQILTPILFATRGPRAAGRMGMSLMITTAIWLVAQAWVNTRAVDFGSLVAARAFDELDRVFRRVFIQSSAVALGLSVVVISGVCAVRLVSLPLGERLLPPVPFTILTVASLLHHVVSTEAVYLRAFKREPFLAIFLAIGAITASGSLAVGSRFGETGMVTVLALAMGIIGVGRGTAVFAERRVEWCCIAQTNADTAQKDV
jgi:hypothetical protein